MRGWVAACFFLFCWGGLISPSQAGDGCDSSSAPGCGGCKCEQCVCAMDNFCCTVAWDSLCVDQCNFKCGGCGSGNPCGDGLCQTEIGEHCGNCAADCPCNPGQFCHDNSCCTPNCWGKTCGTDGCGGSCGECQQGTVCLFGNCCLPDCQGKECGDDGCWGSCGQCSGTASCQAGKCVACQPECSGKQCGSDGCGGLCGVCAPGASCVAGLCVAPQECQPLATISCGEKITGDTAEGVALLTNYSCESATKKGAEVAYLFVPEADAEVTAKLTKTGGYGYPGLFLLADSCLGQSCLQHEFCTIKANLSAGQSYFFVVDTLTSSTAQFVLTLSCKGECLPQCEGKECGDDGCGGSCGECGWGNSCVAGKCLASGGFGWPCVGGYECWSGFCVDGPEGKVCSMQCNSYPCPEGWFCSDLWVWGKKYDVCTSECQPDCPPENECGDNGCGFPCGQCAPGLICEEGTCVEPPCLPKCDAKECGQDGCGGRCGQCPQDHECKLGLCQPVACLPDCAERQCGPSNCRGVDCGQCPEGEECVEGKCVEPACSPDCGDQECGPSNCRGLSCGLCEDGHQCQEGRCVVIPCQTLCGDRQCGDDGCGGSCGECIPPRTCVDWRCLLPLDEEEELSELDPDLQIEGDSLIVPGQPAVVLQAPVVEGPSCSAAGAGRAEGLLLMLLLLAVIAGRRRTAAGA